MAPDPNVTERVYAEIRRRLFEGAFKLRQRLDVAALSEATGASATPVREALVRLAAERLIASRPTRGFFLTLWSESELCALYDWRHTLTRLALARTTTLAVRGDQGTDHASASAALFQAVEAPANIELRRAGQSADDRLHPARRAEAALFADVDQERTALIQALESAVVRKRNQALKLYYARRRAALRALRERAALLMLAANGE